MSGDPPCSTHLNSYSLFKQAELRFCKRLNIELNIRDMFTQMKSSGLPTELIRSYRRQQMLRGVLLHMIEPTLPVEF